MPPFRLLFAALALAAGAVPAVADPPSEPSSDLRPVDLSKPFATRAPWQFVVTQGPPVEDFGGDMAPGALQLCLKKDPAGPCVSDPVSTRLTSDAEPTLDWGPHYLKIAKPIYPLGHSAIPVFEIQTASMHAVDNGQLVVTQVLRYDRTRDAFERVYFHRTGTNHNEQIRFVGEGALKGSLISAEPTENAPFGYWIVVGRFTPAGTYRQVLRYRSATHYSDGNSLAVIDSETPNIERRLGLWKVGSPPPLPTDKPCLKPVLKHMELWCA